MTSGPYRSNLLRFAVSQYRKGVARHEVAVRKARSGAVMGAAVTLLPVYAVANASRRLGIRLRRRLQRAVSQKGLSGASEKGGELLHDSQKDRVVLFEGDRIDSLVLPIRGGLSLPERGRALVRSVVSFWVEVLWMMAWLQENASPNSNFQIAGGFDFLGGRSRSNKVFSGKRSQNSLGSHSRPLLNSTGAIQVLGTAPLARMMQARPNEICLSAAADREDCLEASVVTVGYVEHPFETLLNWVDRILVRIESLWRRLMQRLLQWRSVFEDEK